MHCYEHVAHCMHLFATFLHITVLEFKFDIHVPHGSTLLLVDLFYSLHVHQLLLLLGKVGLQLFY